jgi:hypothetical protein
MANFPRNLVPTWIENVNLPTKPNVSQRFPSGGESFLLLSDNPIDGKIKCEFFLTPIQQQDLKDFWAVVGDYESFTLLENFFPISCDPISVQTFKSYSSTGRWRFDGQPTFEVYPSLMATVSIVLKSSID